MKQASSAVPAIPYRTLRMPVEVAGVGLHTGAEVRVHLLPAEERGLVFVRIDEDGLRDGQPIEVPAHVERVTTTKHATTLESEGVTVATTEHLLAALWTMGVTHCRIRMDGPEVPILDGSAAAWCEAISTAGLRDLAGVRPVFRLAEPVFIEDGGGSVLGLPHDSLRLSVAVEYDRSYLEPQTWDGAVDGPRFAADLAPARTFTQEEWLEPLRKAGLIRGGSTANAIILHSEGASVPLRFPDELARHKALDVLGDIALLFGQNGGVLLAHLIAVRAGHGPHRKWMKEVLRRNVLREQPSNGCVE